MNEQGQVQVQTPLGATPSPTVVLYLALAAGALVLLSAAPDLLKLFRRR